MTPPWMPMETAPKTGAAILARVVTFSWNSDLCQNVATGHKVIEIWWASFGGVPSWHAWEGSTRTMSTEHIVPECWMPVP